MTAEVVFNVYGGCIAAGLVLGAVIALFNSWRVG